jgi:hypothetical protein
MRQASRKRDQMIEMNQIGGQSSYDFLKDFLNLRISERLFKSPYMFKVIHDPENRYPSHLIFNYTIIFYRVRFFSTKDRNLMTVTIQGLGKGININFHPTISSGGEAICNN